ncbi:hypothetical protein PR048_003737 [Dryococelus australis]|uniref:Uncharacterized protein n=1 Tax=Dryococelus australis TaxID=614101 RepID=A0ABQ9INW8_9NEOP|nr:hypothetical protein PR048_003737 [Dryococelus australis]
MECWRKKEQQRTKNWNWFIVPGRPSWKKKKYVHINGDSGQSGDRGGCMSRWAGGRAGPGFKAPVGYCPQDVELVPQIIGAVRYRLSADTSRPQLACDTRAAKKMLLKAVHHKKPRMVYNSIRRVLGSRQTAWSAVLPQHGLSAEGSGFKTCQKTVGNSPWRPCGLPAGLRQLVCSIGNYFPSIVTNFTGRVSLRAPVEIYAGRGARKWPTCLSLTPRQPAGCMPGSNGTSGGSRPSTDLPLAVRRLSPACVPVQLSCHPTTDYIELARWLHQYLIVRRSLVVGSPTHTCTHARHCYDAWVAPRRSRRGCDETRTLQHPSLLLRTLIAWVKSRACRSREREQVQRFMRLLRGIEVLSRSGCGEVSEYGAAPGGTGDPRENPPISAIVRHDSRVRKSGSGPGRELNPASRLTAQSPWTRGRKRGGGGGDLLPVIATGLAVPVRFDLRLECLMASNNSPEARCICRCAPGACTQGGWSTSHLEDWRRYHEGLSERRSSAGRAREWCMCVCVGAGRRDDRVVRLWGRPDALQSIPASPTWRCWRHTLCVPRAFSPPPLPPPPPPQTSDMPRHAASCRLQWMHAKYEPSLRGPPACQARAMRWKVLGNSFFNENISRVTNVLIYEKENNLQTRTECHFQDVTPSTWLKTAFINYCVSKYAYQVQEKLRYSTALNFATHFPSVESLHASSHLATMMERCVRADNSTHLPAFSPNASTRLYPQSLQIRRQGRRGCACASVCAHLAALSGATFFRRRYLPHFYQATASLG